MIKKFLFVTLCSITPLLAYDAHSEKDNLQIGRYQMVSAIPNSGIIHLYLLDTATGYVWKSTTKKNWVDHDYWQLQISTPPQQP